MSGGRARSGYHGPDRICSESPDHSVRRTVGVFLDTRGRRRPDQVVALGEPRTPKMRGPSDRWRAHRGAPLRDPGGLLHRPGPAAVDMRRTGSPPTNRSAGESIPTIRATRTVAKTTPPLTSDGIRSRAPPRRVGQWRLGMLIVSQASRSASWAGSSRHIGAVA